jgi:NADH:ubiquinone reductase (H+-translocating)
MNQSKLSIIIAGSGFAGMWSALSAARALGVASKENDVDIKIVSPTPNLHIRPRFYEQAFTDMAPDIAPLLTAVGVEHIGGTVEEIATDRHEVLVKSNAGETITLPYSRFILATGSKLFLPDIAGLKDFAFNVDQLADAVKLDEHLKALAHKPETNARNTIVVAGGGFTGIETVAEMPERLRNILGPDAIIRVVVLEQAPDIGPDLGPGPRPIIEQALNECGVEVKTATGAASIDVNGVTTSTGEVIETNTVIWTAGSRAHPLAAQLDGEHDRYGRVLADQYLHAKGADDVFVTGDVVNVSTDEDGNTASMSCQHALSLGRVSGHNAAAELVGLALHPYSQPKYVTCLDLGPWGAVYTEGWERQVHMKGAEAKELKRAINTQWIYPPAPDRDAAFETANPDHVIVP